VIVTQQKDNVRVLSIGEGFVRYSEDEGEEHKVRVDFREQEELNPDGTARFEPVFVNKFKEKELTPETPRTMIQRLQVLQQELTVQMEKIPNATRKTIGTRIAAALGRIKQLLR
jgi:hypothetical protein